MRDPLGQRRLAEARDLLGQAAGARVVLSLLASGCGFEPPGSAEDAATPRAVDAGLPADATVKSDAAGADASVGPVTLTGIRVVVEGPPRLSLSATASASATGLLSDGREIDLTQAATWSTSSSTVVRASAGGRLVAEGIGQAELWATRGAIESNHVSLVVAPLEPLDTAELRGVWVTRWSFSDPGDVQGIIDAVAAANFNAIFFQARGTADAYYASTLEPWAARLSGQLGGDPGWDPLGEVVARAHERGLEVHAWINTFPAWSGATPPPESAIRHPLLTHPEWLCADEEGSPMPPRSGDYQYFSPGNEAVRQHIRAVVGELLSRYDVDGIHLDFVRYPGPGYCHDLASERAYALARGGLADLSWEDFQRSRVTDVVRQIRQELELVRPGTRLSVAAWPIYRNRWGWPSVSKGYDDYYQDSHAWLESGLVDALCPMTYWAMTTPKGLRTDFATLVDDHVAAARAAGRYVFAGVSAEHSGDELLRQVAYARSAGAKGLVFFDFAGLVSGGHLRRLAAGPFLAPALLPRYPWR